MVSVNTSNLGSLQGMPDVEFDFGVSAELKRAFRAAATALSGQRGARQGYRTDGGTDFEGHFSQVFATNGTVQIGDLDEIVTNLRLVATKVAGVEEEARAENERRRKAREWATMMANRGELEKLWHGLVGEPDPPVTEVGTATPQAVSVSAPTSSRDTPTPSTGGGGGGGTSSARPAKLRTFATNTRNADSELAGKPGELTTQTSTFASACSWATLDASGVITAFSTWLTANEEDARWADIVAGAFEAAGGDGQITISNSVITAALSAAGVSQSRTDIQVDPPTAYGSPPTTGYSNDPVNTASGNFLENEVDLAFTGPAASLVWTRTYNSLNGETGSFGPGWSSWPEAGLAFTDDAARLTLPDGRVVVFPREGDGWARATGENLWLDRTGAGFAVSTSTGLRFELDAAGSLAAVDGGPGSRLDLLRDATGTLIRIEHEFSRAIDVRWADGRVVGLEASDGRVVAFTYEAGRLVAAAGPAGTRSYGWNAAGLVDRVTDADGVVEAENTYDEQGRVATQLSPFGRVTRFTYLPGGITAVADTDGSRSNTWVHDTKGRLVGVIDGEGNRQSTAYDPHGNAVMVTERDGQVSVSEYDHRGRRTARVLPGGARHGWAFDDADRVVEVVVENGAQRAVTRYEYAGEDRNPSVAVDPSGGVTRFSWRRGLLAEVVDPTGVRVRFEHDSFGDLVATTDAQGNTARLERDAAGRVTAAITPLGHRTEYRYDAVSGALVSRTDPTGATWRYEHTAAGRQSAVVDPTGARTEMAYGEHGERASTTDALGRTISSSHDDLGRLAAVELPDGSSWSFGYDVLSRLVETTDATGGTWQMQFGPTGYLTGATDATGNQREVETDPSGWATGFVDGDERLAVSRDALGRVVASAAADGGVTTYVHDLCGRVLETTDAAGGVTRITRDAAGRVVAVTQPMGRTFRYEYDACGRWAATVSTGGQRYEVTRDADGRIVAETWPTGEQVHTEHDSNGRVVSRVEPGRGTVRFRYDEIGRITRVSDPWNGARRFAYDAAGQLVSATNALGGVTRFEYNALGQRVVTIDPLGGRSERTYDALGRVLSETDPLGRVTRYSYDAAGRPTKRVDADGRTLEWGYEHGRRSATSADGVVLSRVERDFAGRTVRVLQGETVHELAWDATGNLAHRLRDGVGVRYAYDADGHRTAMVRPDGSTTQYEYDDNGRLAAVEHPGVGRAVLERDALGRIVSLAADGLHATWAYADGMVVEHRVNRRGFLQVTSIERDVDGRIVAQVRDGLRTEYAHDDAGQLIGGQTSEGTSFTYDWDANGRLAAETVDGQVTRYAYDVAGQLLVATGPDGSRTEYAYDGSGRRTREAGPAGERLFAWDAQGFLARITAVRHEGDRVTTAARSLRVDALGELASVDGTDLYWDSAAALPSLAQFGATVVVNALAATALTTRDGVDPAWVLPDAHGRDAGPASPWGLANTLAGAGLPPGASITSSGGVSVEGLEWMQARAYDPATRGFLSTDPLEPVTASAWAGNPYSFAGNDPVNASDPWGLRPVTEAELQAYRDSNNGMLGNAVAAASDWVSNNWEYIVAGALIVGGVAVMCTGIGGPIGAAMIAGAAMGAGSSIWSQKSTNGSVDWGKVALDGAVGAVTGLAGGGAAAAAAKMTSGLTSCLGRNILTGAIQGGMDGGFSGGLSYLTSGQPLTLEGFLSATGQGAAQGTVLGAGGGALSHVTDVARYGCFAEDTPVLMADGSSKAIQHVAVGDEVLAFNAETGANESARVSRTFVHEDVDTLVVTTEQGWVTTTANHPFYVEGRGYTPAGELHEGDQLRTPVGDVVVVASIQATGRRQTVYNLEVEGLHNYHVATDSDTWVLVHNNNASCGPDFIASADGVVVPTDRVRLEQGFQDAGLPTFGTSSPGTGYVLPDGTKVRIMEPSGQAPLRASFTTGADQPINPFTGRQPQPGPGQSGAAWKAEFRARTHVELH
ncbi:type IV secretion protein Rhs [Propioniciclava sp. MC1683]|uniref:DUF6531 domain-containing protein n=1 Tax=Propioniciclava sp. MC1683 TaxID=2760309 RepID=UPI0015FFFEBB|nr:DUF6531 domain-containing protein [Propioniciclava sp. MC1683]MBB1499921.1 type IV secretion protein Rhs [Propioniciclava sp. MC1683]